MLEKSHMFWNVTSSSHLKDSHRKWTHTWPVALVSILSSIASKISMSHYRTRTLEKITSRSLPLLYFFENHPKDRFEAEKEICHHDPSANGCPWKRLLLHSPIHHCRGCESIGPDIFHGAPQGKARQIFSFRLYHSLPLFLIIFYMEMVFFLLWIPPTNSFFVRGGGVSKRIGRGRIEKKCHLLFLFYDNIRGTVNIFIRRSKNKQVHSVGIFFILLLPPL